jgi:hypothetical protein
MPHLPDYAICVISPSREAAADRQQDQRGASANSASSPNTVLDLGYAALPARQKCTQRKQPMPVVQPRPRLVRKRPAP